MGNITRLADDLCNQIAAGEVVERPASVVKELVENAIDAGSTRIAIDIGAGGTGVVRVTDNGAGMDETDAVLAVERHATSKIRAVGDLLSLSTFGFRGEALPSIASVSKFSLRSRCHHADAGVEVSVESGRVTVVPCGMAPGTIVEVRELFFNVPARRKFLKSVGSESAAVSSAVEGLTLSQPTVAFVLHRDGKLVREWLRVSSREQRATLNRQEDQLAPMRGERGPLKVEAYLSPPERARTGANGLAVLVNDRVIRDRLLSRIVAQAYGSVLDPGRYPVGAVYIDIDPSLVDVNVHPQKAEVRFADARAVQDALFRIVTEGLAGSFGIAPASRIDRQRQHTIASHGSFSPHASPPMSSSSLTHASAVPSRPDRSFEHPPWTSTQERSRNEGARVSSGESDPWGLSPRGADKQATEPEAWGTPDANSLGRVPSPPIASSQFEPYTEPTSSGQRVSEQWSPRASLVESTDASIPLASQDLFPLAAVPTGAPSVTEGVGGGTNDGKLRFLAQLRSMFLLCEGADGLVIIDQHAAAERVTFARYRRAFYERAVASQRLLVPASLVISAEEMAFLEEEAETIEATGLEIRVVGSNQGLITAVPQILARADPERIARDLLDEARRCGSRGFSGAVDRVLATMACHGSIRAGEAVSAEEAHALIGALDDVEFAGHCPHGRPLLMKIRYSELERLMGRR